MTARLAADIGGTFTDLVLLDAGGGVHVAKTLSTPGDFKEGVLSGVERVLADAGAETEGAIALADVDYFVHGATVVLNALLERKLPKAALVTTRGFRDVLEIMRTNNSRMYDLKWVKPKPIIPRHLRFEVAERVRHTGEVLRPLDEAGTRETARRIKALDIRSVALCFLHAYANPDHERRAREIILEEHPAAHVTISSDVASELREFERTSTVAINASTIPIISAYLDGLSQALSDRGLERELFVMQSNGGVIASRTARSLPVRTVMSGPAGGVVGAQFIGNRMGLRDVATIDIGGTSSDMGVISEGLARTVDQSAVEGWPIMAPTIEILAIGAGGAGPAPLRRQCPETPARARAPGGDQRAGRAFAHPRPRCQRLPHRPRPAAGCGGCGNGLRADQRGPGGGARALHHNRRDQPGHAGRRVRRGRGEPRRDRPVDAGPRLMLASVYLVPRQQAPFWLRAATFVGGIALGLLIAYGVTAGQIVNEFVVYVFLDLSGLAQVVTSSTPLVLVGLASAAALKLRFWNIGVEGQMWLGCIAATGVAIFDLGPDSLRLPLMFIAAAAAGACWIGIPAFLKLRFRVDEIITSLLLIPRIQAMGFDVPIYLVGMLPYVLTLAVLIVPTVLRGERSPAPSGLLLNYLRQDRR